MIEHNIKPTTAKIDQLLFVSFARTNDFERLWIEAGKEATQTKSSFIVFVEGFVGVDLGAWAQTLKENIHWLRSNAYLTTASGNLIVVNLKLCRGYGSPGHQGFKQFQDWLQQKVISEGQKCAQLQEEEFVTIDKGLNLIRRHNQRSQRSQRSQEEDNSEKCQEPEPPPEPKKKRKYHKRKR